MVTVTISIKPYLASYLHVRCGQSVEPLSSSTSPAIRLSHLSPLYHILYQLTTPHPQDVPWREQGNATFVIPTPRYGKNPQVYNYIGYDHARVIEEEIEVEMKAELYSYLLYNKYTNGVMYKKSMEQFVDKYHMAEQVEESSLMRAFQRWRKKVKEERWAYLLKM